MVLSHSVSKVAALGLPDTLGTLLLACVLEGQASIPGPTHCGRNATGEEMMCEGAVLVCLNAAGILDLMHLSLCLEPCVSDPTKGRSFCPSQHSSWITARWHRAKSKLQKRTRVCSHGFIDVLRSTWQVMVQRARICITDGFNFDTLDSQAHGGLEV